MSTDGNISINNGNGAKNAAWAAFGKESLGLGVAEFVSMGVSLGVVAIADQVAPHMLKDCSKALGKVLSPYLERIENGLQTVCKLEECKPDLSKSHQEREEALAKMIIVVGAAGLLSFVAKLGVRTGMNALLKVPGMPKSGNWMKDLLPSKHDLKIVVCDEGIHIGSLLMMNTMFAKQSDELINSTSSLLQKCGIPEKKSKEIAAMGVIWELPNFLGWLAGVGAIAHEKFGKSYVEKLAQQNAAHTPATNLVL